MISASVCADFPLIRRESALFSRGCKISSLRAVPCSVTAKASAPQVPRRVFCRWLQKGVRENTARPKAIDVYVLSCGFVGFAPKSRVFHTLWCNKHFCTKSLGQFFGPFREFFHLLREHVVLLLKLAQGVLKLHRVVMQLDRILLGFVYFLLWYRWASSVCFVSHTLPPSRPAFYRNAFVSQRLLLCWKRAEVRRKTLSLPS